MDLIFLQNIYFNIKCSLSPEVLSSLQPKDVVLRKSLAEDEEGAFWIEVCLTEAVIFNHLRDVSLRRINSDLQVIMSHFCGTRRPGQLAEMDGVVVVFML